MTENKPTVSFVIPILGDEITGIEETLISLNKLEFSHRWDVLVAYETLNVPKKLYSYIENKLTFKTKIIQIPVGTGLPASLNIAIKESDSIFIARIDAGDKLFSPDRVTQQVKFLEKNPDYWCVGSSIRIFDEAGNVIRIRNYPETNSEIIKASYYINPIAHPSVIFRRKEFFELGGYDTNEFNEDFALWVKSIASGYKLYNLQLALTDYLITTANKSRSRLFYPMLKLRFRYLKSIIRLFFISVPITLLQLIMFKFPSIYNFINKKYR